MQLIGQPYCEAELLGIARAYERDHPWAQKNPVL